MPSALGLVIPMFTLLLAWMYEKAILFTKDMTRSNFLWNWNIYRQVTMNDRCGDFASYWKVSAVMRCLEVLRLL